MMRHRISLGVLALVALAASLLASCGGDDEGYPPFEMMYVVSRAPEGSEQTWQLDYRSADDWTKTVVEADDESDFPVGRTAVWDGERIAWADSPDGPFVRDGSPEHNPGHAVPEYWLGYRLEDLPNELFQEVDAPREGTRRFRNEYPIGWGDGSAVGLEVVTFDVETNFPVEYQNTLELGGIDLRYRVLELDLR